MLINSEHLPLTTSSYADVIGYSKGDQWRIALYRFDVGSAC